MNHRLVSTLGATAMAALVAFGTLGPAASAAPAEAGYRANSPEYGMSVFLYGNPATTARDITKLSALNFGWQKSLFRWRDIEGAGKGQFDWAKSDRVVAASASAGLKIIARLDFQPTWARLDGANNGAPDNYQDFADFVWAFVDRYKAGSPYGTVQAIEVWNEVNLFREWGSPISPQTAADYVRLLSLAYKAAKLADPSVTVITAGLSPTGWNDDTARPDDEFLQWMYAAGLKGNYDVLGANGNVQCPSVEAQPGACPVMADRMAHPSFYFRRVEQLHDIMVANGDKDSQVWLMEFGWTTDAVNPSYSWYATTEATKADLIVQAFKFAKATWAPWIGVMTLWTLADPNWSANDEQVWWAVTNPDGTTRPAYDRLMEAVAANELPLLSGVPAPPVAAAAIAVPAPVTNETAPVAPASQRLQVIDNEVSLRATPSTTAARLKVLSKGAILVALGDAQQNEGRAWRNVRDLDGAEGWVAAEFLAPAQ